MTTTIKLQRGQELVVNGYTIRAIGLDAKRPDQLSIRKRGWPTLWAGYCDDVVLSPQVVIGANPQGLPARVKQTNAYVFLGSDPHQLSNPQNEDKL